MKLKMKENSLFAILLRSPWWISFLIAAVIGLIARAALPEQFSVYAAFVGAPFLVVGLIAAWQQLRRPGAARVACTLDAVANMSWPGFADAVEHGFRREGYAVTRFAGDGADFEISKADRRVLVACKRWKAARQGIEPLRELSAAAEARGIRECIYLTAGEVTENARRFAAANHIDLLQGVRLAQLLREVKVMKKASR
jgi:restriction system protein